MTPLRPRLALLLATVLACQPGLARAAAPCLTATEVTSLATYALPGVITGAADRCASRLGARSWLTVQAPAIAQRYAPGRSAAWPAARAAFLRVAGAAQPDTADMLRGLPDGPLQQMADALVTQQVGRGIPADRCPAIERVIQLIDPLPAETVAELIVVTAGLTASTGQARLGRFAICPA